MRIQRPDFDEFVELFGIARGFDGFLERGVAEAGLAGNPAAVVPDARALNEAEMQALGDVVGRLRRAAGIREIVRVILRFEHVHHMRTE